MASKSSMPASLKQSQQLTISSKSLASSSYGRSPIEMYQMRRVCLREQKRQLILRKLEESLPIQFLVLHSLILAAITITIVVIQIALIVYKSALYYLCIGFWSGAVFIIAIILNWFLIINRTYNYLIASLIFNLLGIFVSVGGLISLNIISLSLYNTSCFTDCSAGSRQYLNLIVVIFGAVAIIVCSAYLFIIDFLVLKEARALNVYLETAPRRK